MAFQNTHLKLLLISKTSYDKHATINTLTKEDTFDISEEPELKITEYKWGNGHVVVDTPGLMDVAEESKVCEEITKYRRWRIPWFGQEGLHAIGLVLRYPVRMTPEESRSIKKILDLIGESKFRKFGILIFTNGISFKKLQGDPNENFKEYLQSEVKSARSNMAGTVNESNVHEYLGNLIAWVCPDEKYEYRCMFIDNDEPEEQDKYIDEVEKLVKGMKESNKDTYNGKCHIL